MNSIATKQTRRHRLTPAAERNRRAACERKRRYSRREAQAAAGRATARTGKRHRAYRCDWDHGGEHWHITSQAERKA